MGLPDLAVFGRASMPQVTVRQGLAVHHARALGAPSVSPMHLASLLSCLCAGHCDLAAISHRAHPGMYGHAPAPGAIQTLSALPVHNGKCVLVTSTVVHCSVGCVMHF